MSDIAFFILLLFLFAVLLRLDFAFYIIYVLFGVYALGWWGTRRGLSAVSTRRLFTDHAFLGEQVRVTLEIGNRSWLPLPWVRINETVPVMLRTVDTLREVVTLKPKETVAIHYDLDCVKRGYYPLGPTHLMAGDLFGFAEVEARGSQVDHLTVYPHIIPLTELGLPSRLPFGTIRSQQRLFEDPARLAGLRDYQWGDSLRRIHWKASAHADALLVKKVEPAISLETMILLNLNQEEYTREWRLPASEWAIVVAASVANHLIGQRQAVGLGTNGLDPLGTEAAQVGVLPHQESGRVLVNGSPPTLLPRPGRGHLMKLLEVLARVELHETIPFVAWLPQAVLSLGWGTTVIAITPAGDETTCRALHRLYRTGFNVILLVVEPTAQIHQVRERARQLGLTAYAVSREQDLERWQAQARSGRRR
ncbi:MAG TPA: DUF58 domain-containing protein [Anaerolineae bacterium]|nr:DUF58 domain-containing protein [Anaerolineae bacterium]